MNTPSLSPPHTDLNLMRRDWPLLCEFGFAGSCQSAPEVSGDIYDVVPLPDGLLLLFIADVMGKGPPAARFAHSFRALVRTLAQPTNQPGVLLAEMNQLMFDQLSAADLFITAQIVIADLHHRQMHIASAGHCPLLLSDEPAGFKTLAPEGLPLGIQANATFCDQTAAFPAFGSVLLYTDGVTEARSSSGHFFGQQHLGDWLGYSVQNRRTAAELRDSLLEELAFFQAGQPSVDDQTFLLLSDQTPRAGATLWRRERTCPESVVIQLVA